VLPLHQRQLLSHPQADSQGDPGGGVPRPARRGGGDDKKQAGGERARGARGWAMAGDVLCGGVDVTMSATKLNRKRELPRNKQ